MVSLLGGGLFGGNPLGGALGDKEEKDDKKEVSEEEETELAEARREEEERRADKYRKMEEERETMRQGIRDKYGIKKKEAPPMEDPGLDGRLGRKKKTPEEMEAEANGEIPPSSTGEASMFPKNLDELQARVQELPGKVMTSVSDAKEKCSLQ